MYVRLKQNGVLGELYNDYQNRLGGLIPLFSSVPDELVAAAAFIEQRTSRILTKAFYATQHAWLLLFPRYLSIDWGGLAFVFKSKCFMLVI